MSSDKQEYLVNQSNAVSRSVLLGNNTICLVEYSAFDTNATFTITTLYYKCKCCKLLGCNELQQLNLDESCNILQLIHVKSVNQDSDNACVIFGDFVKSTRLQNHIIARDAASNAGMLPSNFSKMEHGALRPPMDAAKQKSLATSIGIALGSDAAARFFDLAGKATASTPADLADIISREEALPLLLRTIGNKRLGQREIERLVSLVRDTNVQPENTSA